MRRLLLILLFALSCTVAVADTSTVADPHPQKVELVVDDTVKPVVRNFDRQALSRYRRDPALSYIEGNKKTASFWDRFWKWFWELINKLFGGKQQLDTSGNGLKYLIIALAVGLVVYGLIKLTGVNLMRLFDKDSPQGALPYQETLENIHEINFDDDIESALAQRNFKLAVRLLYLRSLKQLNDAGLIHWQIEKTNSVYVDELSNPNQRQTFSILTRQFEYVWYGNFPIDEQAFRNINTLFQDFKQILA